MESSFSSEGQLSLRWQLQQILGPLRESGRPDLGDLVGRGPALTANPWAEVRQALGLIQVRYFDSTLMQLGRPGQSGRAGHLTRLSQALQAQTGSTIPPDLRPLWLALESLDHQPRETVWRRATQSLHQLYENQALAGREQSQRGYPRLAQLALIAGGLERLAPGEGSRRPE